MVFLFSFLDPLYCTDTFFIALEISQNCRIGGLEGTYEGHLVQCLCNEPKTLPINPYQGVKQAY